VISKHWLCHTAVLVPRPPFVAYAPVIALNITGNSSLSVVSAVDIVEFHAASSEEPFTHTLHVAALHVLRDALYLKLIYLLTK